MNLGQLFPWGYRRLVYPYSLHVTDTGLDLNDPADRIRIQKKRQRALEQRKRERHEEIIKALENDERLTPEQKKKILSKLGQYNPTNRSELFSSIIALGIAGLIFAALFMPRPKTAHRRSR